MKDKEEKHYESFVPTEEFLKAQEELANNMFNRMVTEGFSAIELPSVSLNKFHESLKQDDEIA